MLASFSLLSSLICLECPEMSETTVLGAALAAGRAVGVWAQPSLLPAPPTSTFTPSIGHDGKNWFWSSHVQVT